MNSEFVESFVYGLILYVSFGCTLLPVLFYVLWAYLPYWKKHRALFYGLALVLLAGPPLVFYFTQQFWIYWYYAFPEWIQIIGLFLIVSGCIVAQVAQSAFTFPVRFFYTLLNEHTIHLQSAGIYKYVRHPIYAVYPWIVLGATFYTGQLALLPVFFFNIVERANYAQKEEQYLKKVVIGDYEHYMKQTPNRFYPKLF